MTEADDAHILGPADQFAIEAVGEPGDRRFRILVQGPGGNATIWLEKEDMSRLALSVERLLQMVERNVGEASSRGSNVEELPTESPSQSFEFQSGSWAVGYLESAHVIEFQAHDIEDEDDSQPRLRFWATMAQSQDWSSTLPAVPWPNESRIESCVPDDEWASSRHGGWLELGLPQRGGLLHSSGIGLT